MNGVQFLFGLTFFSTAFFLICVYFDKYRHEDPYFRKKLKLKRKKTLILKKASEKSLVVPLKEIEDHEAFIFKEIQIAEVLMEQHEEDKAVIHFANAIGSCVDAGNLLLALKKTLPFATFDLLVKFLFDHYPEHVSKLQEDHMLKKLFKQDICYSFNIFQTK